MVLELLAVIFAGAALLVSLAAYLTSRRSAAAAEASAEAATRSASASERATAIQVAADDRRLAAERVPAVSVVDVSETFDSVDFRLVLTKAPIELTLITIERVDSDRWLRRAGAESPRRGDGLIEWRGPVEHSSIALTLEPTEIAFVLELEATAYDGERWRFKVQAP